MGETGSFQVLTKEMYSDVTEKPEIKNELQLNGPSHNKLL